MWEAAKADIAALPDRELQLAALRLMADLSENPYLGESLRNRAGVGDLSSCRRIRFDQSEWQGLPRYRLVYRNDPSDGSIAIVQVIAVGLRERLTAYREAATRVRRELRRRLRDG